MSSAGTSVMSNAHVANEAIHHMISQAGAWPADAPGVKGRSRKVGLSFKNGLIKILVAPSLVERSHN